MQGGMNIVLLALRMQSAGAKLQGKAWVPVSQSEEKKALRGSIVFGNSKITTTMSPANLFYAN